MEEVDLEWVGYRCAGVHQSQRNPRIVMPLIGGPSIGAKLQTLNTPRSIGTSPTTVSAHPPMPKDAPRMINATPRRS